MYSVVIVDLRELHWCAEWLADLSRYAVIIAVIGWRVPPRPVCGVWACVPRGYISPIGSAGFGQID